jgi:hypothetical protein
VKLVGALFLPYGTAGRLLMAVLLAICGCVSSLGSVSELDFEHKIAELQVGHSDKQFVEALFGSEHATERNHWIYHFAEKQFTVSERRQAGAAESGGFPLKFGVVPINTKAVIALTFNASGVVSRVEIARFFDQPFVNDYWYLIKPSSEDPLTTIATLAESAGFRVAGLDKGAGILRLEDPPSQARVTVKLEGSRLRMTSINSHDRLSKEYRIFAKRESALTAALATSNLVE